MSAACQPLAEPWRAGALLHKQQLVAGCIQPFPLFGPAHRMNARLAPLVSQSTG